MPRYIDADALKDVIQQHDYPLADRLNSVDNGMFTLGIFQAIDQMPTVSPDEVRGVGKWIERVDYDWDIYHECSVCHMPFTMLDGTTPELNDYHYCPNCGAKMEVTSDA